MKKETKAATKQVHIYQLLLATGNRVNLKFESLPGGGKPDSYDLLPMRGMTDADVKEYHKFRQRVLEDLQAAGLGLRRLSDWTDSRILREDEICSH